MYKDKTIILANGSFPKATYLLQILDSAKQIICCDGAVNKLVDSGREPSLIIGDLDSVNPDIKERFSDRLICVKDQNTNDLTKAVNWCLSQSIDDILILGATGEREDHTIANIFLLSKYQDLLKVRMLTDKGVFIPISETSVLDAFVGQQISIFSQTYDVEISSEGLKYPLHNLKLDACWMGTLNEAVSPQFKISFEGKASVIVYLLNKE